MPSFLKGRAALVLTAFLLAQCMLFYGFSRGEKPPTHTPLDQFPRDIAGWHMVQQGVMEQEVKDVLRADDYLTREYATSNAMADLFVAFFNSQRAGQTPHSPKNCLPGAGWVWIVNDTIPVDISGRSPIVVNRYVVAKGEEKSVVLYWYQSRDRVVAREYQAAAYSAWDALRYNRSDTALVRVIVGFTKDQEGATQAAIRFIQATFPTLRQYFPQ